MQLLTAMEIRVMIYTTLKKQDEEITFFHSVTVTD